MKRFMADFIGTDAGKPTRQQHQQPKSDPADGTGVAFVSPDKKSKGPRPICHACNRQYKGGWELCDQITKKVRANIGKLVAAGTFDDKSIGGEGNTTASKTSDGGRPTKQKRETANTVVKEEDG